MYFLYYNTPNTRLEVNKTEYFVKWLKKLKDRQARIVIIDHIGRMEEGNLGNIKFVGNGIYEKKINYGPGYRLYFCQIGGIQLLLLGGGDKSAQRADIDKAREIKKELKL
ncbi:MAG: type II toxin-antitoxin system RelE/ParE family toxin [bacterium]|nr:type II toxin-antitoxin system RelE/ParE family toxin [bacterium]